MAGGRTSSVEPAGAGVGLFAKPPTPGSVKTRLCPPLAPEEAAALYRAFLADVARTLDSDPRWSWTVFSPDPPGQQATWPDGAPGPGDWRPQEGRDLGERIENALGWLLAGGHRRAVLLGSDHPTVTPAMLAEAFAALRTADVVLGPSLDGGYYLVGTSGPTRGLFEGIPWSTPEAFERTLQRIRQQGLTPAILAPWYDVDTVADLRLLDLHLQTLEREGAPRCSETARVLAGLRERIA